MRYTTKRPTKRYNRIANAFFSGASPDTEDMAQTQKRGRQPEADTNDAIGVWRKHKQGLVLERNKRRLATPVGYDKPIMLGWLSPGSPDWIGYQSVLITPDMLNKRVAIFVGVEAKRLVGGRLSEDQQTWLDNARDAGAIVGVARTANEAEEILRRYRG